MFAGVYFAVGASGNSTVITAGHSLQGLVLTPSGADWNAPLS